MPISHPRGEVRWAERYETEDHRRGLTWEIHVGAGDVQMLLKAMREGVITQGVNVDRGEKSKDSIYLKTKGPLRPCTQLPLKFPVFSLSQCTVTSWKWLWVPLGKAWWNCYYKCLLWHYSILLKGTQPPFQSVTSGSED